MKEVFIDPDPARVGLYKTVLENAGIGCFIRGEYGSTSLASRKSTFFAPSLCVLNDEDYDRAKALLAEFAEAPMAVEEQEWTCPACQEAVPGTFDSCWKCGAVRPGLVDS